MAGAGEIVVQCRNIELRNGSRVRIGGGALGETGGLFGKASASVGNGVELDPSRCNSSLPGIAVEKYEPTTPLSEVITNRSHRIHSMALSGNRYCV